MVGSYRKVSVLRMSINKKVWYFPTINYLGYHDNSSIIQMWYYNSTQAIWRRQISCLNNYALGAPELVGNQTEQLAYHNDTLFFRFKRAPDNLRPIWTRNQVEIMSFALKSYQKIASLNPYPKFFNKITLYEISKTGKIKIWIRFPNCK